MAAALLLQPALQIGLAVGEVLAVAGAVDQRVGHLAGAQSSDLAGEDLLGMAVEVDVRVQGLSTRSDRSRSSARAGCCLLPSSFTPAALRDADEHDRVGPAAVPRAGAPGRAARRVASGEHGVQRDVAEHDVVTVVQHAIDRDRFPAEVSRGGQILAGRQRGRFSAIAITCAPVARFIAAWPST